MATNFTARFPLVASAVAALPARSCLIDGEAIVCDENGLAVFELIRGHDSKTSAVLCAFDLLELDGTQIIAMVTAFVIVAVTWWGTFNVVTQIPIVGDQVKFMFRHADEDED
jgi:hypothetical protein